MQLQKFIDEGEFALARGAYDTAEGSFKRGYDAAKSSQDFALAAQAARGLAQVYEARKDYQRMASCAAEASSLDLEFWGPICLQVALDAEIAGRAYLYLTDLNQSGEYLLRALDLKGQYYGSDHEEALSVRRTLLIQALALQQYEVAYEQHSLLLPRYRTISGGRSWDAYLGLDGVVACWIQLGRRQETKMLLAQAEQLLSSRFPTNSQELLCVEQLRRHFFPDAQAQSASPQQRSDRVQMPQLKPPDTSSSAGFADNMTALAQSHRLRAEIPYFLDDLVAKVLSGMYWQNAIASIAQSQCASYPILGAHLKEAVRALQSDRKSLTLSLREIGKRYDIQELDQLASVLDTAQRTGGSIGPALKASSEAIKAQLKSNEKKLEGMLKAFKWF